jgi:hypothetical protein
MAVIQCNFGLMAKLRAKIKGTSPWTQARLSLALYFTFYNFCRIHKTLKVAPAMAAGVTDKLWSMEDIVALIERAR